MRRLKPLSKYRHKSVFFNKFCILFSERKFERGVLSHGIPTLHKCREALTNNMYVYFT